MGLPPRLPLRSSDAIAGAISVVEHCEKLLVLPLSTVSVSVGETSLRIPGASQDWSVPSVCGGPQATGPLVSLACTCRPGSYPRRVTHWAASCIIMSKALASAHALNICELSAMQRVIFLSSSVRPAPPQQLVYLNCALSSVRAWKKEKQKKRAGWMARSTALFAK